MISNTFGGLLYEGSDCDSQVFNEEIEFLVKGLGNVYVTYELCHSWYGTSDDGDYWTAPSWTLDSEETDITVNDIYFDFDIEVDSSTMEDIMNRLSHFIELSMF